MHSSLLISFYQRHVSRQFRLFANATKRSACVTHQPPGRASSTENFNQPDENETTPVFDTGAMRNDPLRITLQTIHSTNTRKIYPRNSGGSKLGYGELEVQIRYNNDNRPFVVILVDRKSYYINPFPNFLRFMASNNTGTPVLSDVIFTRLNWKSAFTILPQIVTAEQFKKNETVSVFGPPGIGDVFSSSLTLLFSVRAREQHRSKLIFHEHFDNAVNVVESKPLNVFVVNIALKKSTLFNQTVSSNTCTDTVSGYIFEYTTDSTQPVDGSSAVYSWDDFCTIEEYIEYIRNFKSKLSEHETSSSKTTFAFLDLPNSVYFDEMLKENRFHFHHESNSKISCIFHMSPPELYNSSKYQMWIKSFGPMCKHVLISERNSFRMFNYKLECYRGICHTLQPQFFPVHGNKHCLNVLRDILQSAVPSKRVVPFEVYYLNRENKQLLPKAMDKFSENISKTSRASLDLIPLSRPVSSELNHELAEIDYPRVVVLGSGGSHVSLQRASPCFLLQLNNETSMLLDCGGNTAEQLERHFGVDLLPHVLSTIKVIMISHKHTDHWVGLLGLLHQMQSKVKKFHEIITFLPHRLTRFFKIHCLKDEKEAFSKVTFCSIEETLTNTRYRYVNRVVKKAGIRRLTLVPVDHGLSTFGFIIECQDGKKIVYSSDTLPLCEKLIEKGKNAELLIHDSLYVRDENAALAAFKMHSTMRGAVATAHKMNAKNVMLTHFSGAFNVVPTESLEISEPYDGNILYAIDHLEVSLSHLKYFPYIHDSLKDVFPIDDEKKRTASDKKTSELVDLYGAVSKTFV